MPSGVTWNGMDVKASSVKRLGLVVFLLASILISVASSAMGGAFSHLESQGRGNIYEVFPEAGLNEDRIPEILCLYTVLDGKLSANVFDKVKLKKTGKLMVDGYVSGVVALCEQEMSISVGGRMLSKIERGEDGGLRLDTLIDPHPKGFSMLWAIGGKAISMESIARGGLEGVGVGYSLFANPTGNLISAEKNLPVIFEKEGVSALLEVEQKGDITLQLNASYVQGGVAFRYIGTRLQDLRKAHGDLEARLLSIAEGVKSVESMFNAELVSQVAIIDCEGIHNAITSREGAEIWFYVDAFLNEPLAELSAIAAHEALHKLVGKLRLTENTDMRKLFAELRGYDLFSRERFMLVMTGSLPPDSSEPGGPNDIFFSFIDEKNFIDGMKGGHSGENLDEFCASMAHSLMLVDRLEQNLGKRLLLSSSEDPRFLTKEERASVLESYAKVTGCLIEGLQSKSEPADSLREEAITVFERGARKALEVGDKCRY